LRKDYPLEGRVSFQEARVASGISGPISLVGGGSPAFLQRAGKRSRQRMDSSGVSYGAVKTRAGSFAAEPKH